MVPVALDQSIKDVLMFRNLKEDVMTSAEMKSLIHERISDDVMNQVISWTWTPWRPPSSLYLQSPPGSRSGPTQGPTQGAVGKSGAGIGWGGWSGKDQKGKCFRKDQQGKGKDGGQGAGKSERPVGACSDC